MKTLLSKKLTALVLFLLVLATVGVVVTVNAKGGDPNKDPQAALEAMKTRTQRNFIEIILDFFNFNKPKPATKPEVSPQELGKIQNKETPLAAEARISKRDIITRAKEVVNGDYVLEKNDHFSIVYAPAPDSFFISLLTRPVSKTKTEAEKWLTDHGFTPAGLCGLGIHFVAKIDKPTDSEKEVFKQSPTGCP